MIAVVVIQGYTVADEAFRRRLIDTCEPQRNSATCFLAAMSRLRMEVWLRRESKTLQLNF